jgi:hypothetical protein
MDHITHGTTKTSAHRPPPLTMYDKQQTFLLSSNSRDHEKLPEDGTWVPKHVAVCVSNKGVI